MEEISRNSNLKFPEIISGKLTRTAIYITPEGSTKMVQASWGYLPSVIEDGSIPKREKIFKVEYLNLKNLPYASHKQAGYCKIWVWENSRSRAVRGFYFQDSNNKSYTACLITDNSNLIYI